MAGALLLGLSACSSDSGGEGGRGDGNGTSSTSGQGGDGSGGGSGDGSGGDFGNTDTVAGPSPTLPDGGLSTDDDSPDDREVCDSAEIVPKLETARVPGNVLIIFDRSGSMDNDWGNPPGPKWVTARTAVTDALTPLQNDLALVGAILFPNPEAVADPECSVAPFTSGLQFNFVPGATFLQQWNAYWTQPGVMPAGPTPLLFAEQQADVALLDPALMNTTIVIMITDGAPNCVGGVSNADDVVTNLTPLPASWLVNGIKTYVVGLPGSEGATMILDGIAAAGGTGSHIPASDSMTLQAQIAMIVSEAAIGESFPCFIDVDPAPANPDDVHVVVTESGTDSDVPRDFQNGDQAWSINADGTHIEFHGDFCAAVMAGTYENVSVEFGCVSLPPLPPPKPQ